MEQIKALVRGESREQQLLPIPTATAPVFDSTRLSAVRANLTSSQALSLPADLDVY